MTPSARANLGGLLLVCSLGLASAPPGNGPTLDPATLAASKSAEAKLAILGNKDPQPSATYPAVVITEYEINSYLKVHSGETLPKGVHPPTLKVQPEHATASADVDFNELSRSYPNPNDMGPKILAAMFHGTQRATITAQVQSDSSGVRMQIESVSVGSTTMPKWLIDYVVQNILQPEYKFDLTKPLAYPDHVTKVVLGSGQATFLRGPGKTGNSKQ